ILIDTDARSCPVASALRVNAEPGIHDILDGRLRWPEATQHATIGRDRVVDVVASGTNKKPGVAPISSLLRGEAPRLAWHDHTLLRAEQLHLLRLLSWGALSVVSGTALLVFALIRGRGSALIKRFAVVCGTLGAIELAAGMIGYHALAPRDISRATRLEHLAWLELGLFLGLA